MSTIRPIRVRFAPSPTGYLHVGGVRSAIFNWLFARNTKGTYLLRIEDTDHERSKQEYFDAIIDSFTWLNLLPDEPVVIQSKRINDHIKAAQSLLSQNLVYPCFCEAENAEKKIDELEHGIGSKYSGSCRDKNYTEDDLQRPHALRFKVPLDCNSISFNDLIRGIITTAREQLDDFVIVRRDGSPTYNFVVVIDDIFMNISHIIRGEEHISNTPKQILLYNALKKEPPLFAHLPMILGPEGNKLSKRDGAVSIEEYRSLGYLPDALINYLVRLGWSHGDQELFTREEMISYFSLEKIGKKGSIFDSKKLQWINGVYIRQKSVNEIVQAIEAMSSDATITLRKLWSKEAIIVLVALYKDRSTTLGSLAEELVNLAHDPTTLDCSLLKKWIKPYTVSLVNDFYQSIKHLTSWSRTHLAEHAHKTIEKYNAKIIELAQPLRLALTGSVQSPGIFEIIEAVGKERSLKRINLLLAQFNTEP